MNNDETDSQRTLSYAGKPVGRRLTRFVPAALLLALGAWAAFFGSAAVDNEVWWSHRHFLLALLICCSAGIGFSILAMVYDRRWWLAWIALLLNGVTFFLFFMAYIVPFLLTDP